MFDQLEEARQRHFGACFDLQVEVSVSWNFLKIPDLYLGLFGNYSKQTHSQRVFEGSEQIKNIKTTKINLIGPGPTPKSQALETLLGRGLALI